MNGQHPPHRRSPGLAVALLASCLLHGAILLPYDYGQNSLKSSLDAQSSLASRPSLTATLNTLKKTSRLRISPPLEASEEPVPPVPPLTINAPQPLQEQQKGGDLLPLQAPLFYPTTQLSRGPQPLVASDLEGIDTKAIVASGSMVLKLWIDDQGVVVEVEIERSDLPEIFARSVTTIFKRMRFAPGERQGHAVGAIMRIEMRYDDARQLGEAPDAMPAPFATPMPPAPADTP